MLDRKYHPMIGMSHYTNKLFYRQNRKIIPGIMKIFSGIRFYFGFYYYWYIAGLPEVR
jgi:hypothetical protein